MFSAMPSISRPATGVANHVLALLFAVVIIAASMPVGIVAAQTKPAAAKTTDSKSISGLAISNDKPIQIESDNLKISEKQNIATFTGNVKVVQGDMLLRSGKMIVHYASQGGSIASGTSQIQKIDVSDKVYLKSDKQEATADKGTYDMQAQLMTLSGKQVVLTQDKNVFVGCKLIVHVDTSEANLEGCGKRVMIQLDPKSQSADKPQSTKKK